MLTRMLRNRDGFTLVEVLFGLALLTFLVVIMFPLFNLSAETVSGTKSTLNATHDGKNIMEEMYTLSSNVAYNGINYAMLSRGYVNTADGVYEQQLSSGKVLEVSFERESPDNMLVRVKVKVFKDASKTTQESFYEGIYNWKPIMTN